MRYEHDAVGRLLAAREPDGRSTRLRYDAAGRVTHFTDGAGSSTEYRYDDGLAQPSARIDPLGQTMRYAYDSGRNLVALVNAKGERQNPAQHPHDSRPGGFFLFGQAGPQHHHVGHLVFWLATSGRKQGFLRSPLKEAKSVHVTQKQYTAGYEIHSHSPSACRAGLARRA